MIIVRKQIKEMDLQIKQQFTDQIIKYLNKTHVEYVEGYPHFILEKFVKKGIRLAIKNEFKTEYGITLFVIFMFIMSPNFFEYEKIANIFKQYKLDDERIKMINGTLTENDVELIQKKYNEEFWN